MAMQLYEQQCSQALSSIATTTVDVHLLNSAAQAAFLLQGLSLIAASVMDASLENNRTKQKIHLLKTPGSFRASLYQTVAAISNSFRTADHAMLRMRINLDDIPHIMTSVVTAYENPEDEGATFLMNLQISRFQEILKMCSSEANRTRQSFNDTLELIQELVQVTMATRGDNDEKVAEAKKLIGFFETKKKLLEERKIYLQETIENQRRNIEKAEEDYYKAVRERSDPLNIIAAAFADGVKEIFGFFSFPWRTDESESMHTESAAPSEVTAEQNQAQAEQWLPERLNAGAILAGFTHVGSKISKTALGNLQQAVESAKQMYKYQRDLEQLLYNEDVANRQDLENIVSKIIATETDKLEFEEIIVYLSLAVKRLGEIQEHWTNLQFFFATMENEIIGRIGRRLSNAAEIVKQGNLSTSEVLRNELTISAFEAVLSCGSLSRAAAIYNAVSKKYVVPMISRSIGNLVMTREQAKAKLPDFVDKMLPQITQDCHRFLEAQLTKETNETVSKMTRCLDAFSSDYNTEESALSLRTAELVNRGNELLTTFGTQERSLVDLVFREQAVCKQIQSMIDSFDPEQLAHKAVDTMVVLKEAQETYKDIKENIEKIESKEQELRSVIQQIFVRQQQGETETKKIKADLAQINQNLRRIADSIRETQRKLNRLQASLDFLDQHHRVVDRKKRRKRFIVETVGLAVVAISALFVGLSVNEFNEQRNQLITFRNGLKNGISSLIRQQNVNLARKNLLNQEERQRSMNFNSVRNILFSLETKKARGVKYRDYMVSLSSELSQVNNYVERLHSNIHFFSTIHEYLYKADNSSSFVVFLEHIALNSVSQSYRDLNNSWIAAKERPAVKFTMEINETELSPFEVLYFIANTPYN